MAAPPVAKRVPHRVEIHGEVREDPYHWLRFVHDDPDVRAYLEAENAYAVESLAGTAALQRELYDEMVARKKQADVMVPGRRGEYFYYLRTQEGLPYRIHCRRKGHATDAPEEVMLDLNAMAGDHQYLDPGQVRVSPDHRYIAYGLDTSGAEEYRLHIKDLRTGEVLPDEIPDTGGHLVWADNRTLFYNQRDHAGRPYLIWRHTIGEPRDVVVVHEPDIRFNLLLKSTLSGRYVLTVHRSRSTREVRFVDAQAPQGEFSSIGGRQPGLRYDAEHSGDRFFICTNQDAPNFKVVTAPVTDPGHWTDFISHRDDVSVEKCLAFSNHLVTFQRARGLPTVRVDDLRTGATRDIDFDEPTYAVVEKGNLEFDTDTLRLTYSSPATPTSVIDHDLDTGERTLMKQDEILGEYDASRYVVDRIWATSHDGVEVPISLIHHKDTPLDGSTACLLHGYGAYMVNADMSFYPDRFSLIDRGVITAIAHVRGGGELGPKWWDGGRLFNKTNTFFDFIACAEHLIANGYTTNSGLAIEGGSAGGLLIGAVLNMRPELFAAAIAAVPFVDVTDAMLDPTLRMTSTEYEEWGHPGAPEEYAYMNAYSPYDNVKAHDYPHLLVTSGLNDTRVHFWGPARWVAKLRTMKTDSNLLLLRTALGAGHFGPSDRYAFLEQTAFRYAFLLHALGLTDTSLQPAGTGPQQDHAAS